MWNSDQAKLAKTLFSYMNLQVSSFVRGQKQLKLFDLGALSPLPPCRYVSVTDSFNFLATYKFSHNQEELLFLPLVEEQK